MFKWREWCTNTLLCLALNFPSFHTKLPFCHLQGSSYICVPPILINPDLVFSEACGYQELHTITTSETPACPSCQAVQHHVSYQRATHSSVHQSRPIFLRLGKAATSQQDVLHAFCRFPTPIGRTPQPTEQNESGRICQRTVHKFAHQQPPGSMKDFCIFCLKAF